MASRTDHETTHPEPSAAATSTVPPNVKAGGGWKTPLLAFVLTVVVVWAVGTYGYIVFFPRLAYYSLERAIVSGGVRSGAPAIPINSLYTTPTLASPSKTNTLESTGNHDTLYTLGWLDLSSGPQVLHVPDIGDRYYSIQFTDPWGTDFAYVGSRTTGTRAGDYLISGPGWKGSVPSGVIQIVAPDDTVLLIGRTLVQSDSDIAVAYGLARQIQVTPLRSWHPNH